MQRDMEKIGTQPDLLNQLYVKHLKKLKLQ